MKNIGVVLLMGAALALASPPEPIRFRSGFRGPHSALTRPGLAASSPLTTSTRMDGSIFQATSQAQPVTLSPGIGSFQTFCIEETEFISGYAAIYNAQLNTNAMYGSVGPGGDAVSKGTGWLYSQFASGVLASYDYSGATRTTSAGLLQNAIWWLEGEGGISYNAGNIYMAAAVAHFGSQLAAQADGGATYGVYALNLGPATIPVKMGLKISSITMAFLMAARLSYSQLSDVWHGDRFPPVPKGIGEGSRNLASKSWRNTSPRNIASCATLGFVASARCFSRRC